MFVVYSGSENGRLDQLGVTFYASLRPVISLKEDALYSSGDGSSENPYADCLEAKYLPPDDIPCSGLCIPLCVLGSADASTDQFPPDERKNDRPNFPTPPNPCGVS